MRRSDVVRILAITLIAFSLGDAHTQSSFIYRVPYVDTTHVGASNTYNSIVISGIGVMTKVWVAGKLDSVSADRRIQVVRPILRDALVITAERPIQVRYSFLVTNNGAYEDGFTGYSVTEGRGLDLLYIVPLPCTLVSITPLDSDARVTVNGKTDTIPVGQSKRVGPVAAGCRIESNTKIAVCAVNFTPDHYGSTFSFQLVPVARLDTLYSMYCVPPQHPYVLGSAADSSRVYVLAIRDSTTVSADSQEVGLNAGAWSTIRIKDPHRPFVIRANKRICAVYLSDVRGRDPWVGATRSYAYAYQLLPNRSGVQEAVLEPQASSNPHGSPSIQVSVAAFEDGTAVTLRTTPAVRIDTILAGGACLTFTEGFVRGWESAALKISANKKIQISCTFRSWWNGISEHASGYIIPCEVADVIDAVSPEDAVPSTMQLWQNYPNPFNPSTIIRYALAGRAHVTLAVFNVLGEQIRILDEGEQQAGVHEVLFNADRMPSGIYFYRLMSGHRSMTRTFLLLR